MVNADTAYGTGQLPDKGRPDVPCHLNNFTWYPPQCRLQYLQGMKLWKSDLPVMMTAYTPCFRREAGSFARMCVVWTGCINSIKVEIVQLVHPIKLRNTGCNGGTCGSNCCFNWNCLTASCVYVGAIWVLPVPLPSRLWSVQCRTAKWLECSGVSNFENLPGQQQDEASGLKMRTIKPSWCIHSTGHRWPCRVLWPVCWRTTKPPKAYSCRPPTIAPISVQQPFVNKKMMSWIRLLFKHSIFSKKITQTWKSYFDFDTGCFFCFQLR